MLAKIMSGVVLAMGLALWYFVAQANGLRENNVRLTGVIEQQIATLAQQKESISALNESIVVFTAETEVINNTNKKLSSQIVKLRSIKNVKTWIGRMPNSVDKWLRENYSKNRVPKVRNKSGVLVSDPGS